MNKRIKKIIATYFATFLGFSIITCLGADFDFYLEVGFHCTLLGSILGPLIIGWRSDWFKESQDYYAPDIKYVNKDYDVREVNFSIDDYSSDWFDFDVFNSDLYNVNIDFHSDNFYWTRLPADFSATKLKRETSVPDNIFSIHVDSHGVGHGHDIANNSGFDDYLMELCHEGKYNIKGIYDCEYQIKDYKNLKGLCDKIAELSEKSEINKSVGTIKENVSDLASKLSSINGIPKELKEYFSERFVQEISSIKTKEDKITETKRTSYNSGITIKNNGKPIFEINAEIYSVEILVK